ncbi:MAG: transglutaminase-like domain-containing protein, partial [Promethearchaeota archaeon]
MTFNMFGLYNYLPSNEELNSSAVLVSNPSPEYLSLMNKYLQLPPTIGVYKTNNPYFTSQFNILDGIINPTDNAFLIANKIRNYLQTQFSFPMSSNDYNPAPEGRDVVDWFCETKQGLWSDFASAFCAFARAFGVICRFVDGFNSRMIEEFLDNNESQLGFAIKYKNLYNWAEIYVPTDIYGNGKWVQFDIFDSFGGGGSPIIGGNYNITVSTNQTAYIRPDAASITATVSSSTDPIDNITITFRDYTTGRILGLDNTDLSGVASIQTDFNINDIVGPHLIEARFDFFNAGYNLTTILGDISIVLTNINPGEINVSDSQLDRTNIAGFVYDPLNGNRVQGPELNIGLFSKGTNNEVLNAFSPSAINTTYDGDFNDLLNLLYTTAGNYDVRADLNGTWWINTPLGVYDYSLLSFIFQVPYYYITNSSNRLDFNITKFLDIWFYINSLPSDYPNLPPNYVSVSRNTNLNLTAQVISVTSGPIPNKQVFFYDFSRGDILIGSDISDANGYASINYSVGNYNVAGPNLLCAQFGLQRNYSYYILNEKPTINIISGPTPRVINRTGGGATEFNIVGEIFDSTNNSLPIKFSQISLILLKDGVNYSNYLAPSESYPYQTDSTGYFDLTFGVLPTTPPGNYTLRLDFNGTINLLSYPYSYQFNLPLLSTSASYTNELRIEGDASLLFWINGTAYDNYNNPRINRNEDLELTAFIHLSGIPVENGELVEFYDLTENNQFIGSATTIAGNATVIYQTNDSTTAGPHLIYAKWNNKYNYSYFILDAPITIDLDIWPENREVSKFGSFDTTFFIQGYLNDTLNFKPIKYGQISIHMFDGGEIYNGLILQSGSYVTNQFGEIFAEFKVNDFVAIGNYSLEVWFNGTFRYSFPNNIFNEHDFSLSYFSNLSIADNQLRVYDPNDINLYFWINGTPSLPTYYEWDGNYPEQFTRGDIINFTVYIAQSGVEVDSGDVRIYNLYNNSYILDSYTYNGT